MGANPCANSITIEFGCQFRVDIRESSLAAIIMAFSKLLPRILSGIHLTTLLNQDCILLSNRIHYNV